MKSRLLSALLAILPIFANAALTRTDFSGTLDSSLGAGLVGSFSGVLVADWDTGQVNQFYADVFSARGTEPH